MSTLGRVERAVLERWLVREGFTSKGASSSHRRFEHPEKKLVLTVPGHGDRELHRETLGNILRQLTSAGYDRDRVRRELAS